VKEVAAAKGEAADAMPPAGLPAAMKIMTPEQAKTVEGQVNKIPGQATEKDMFKSANAAVEKCKKDTACYLGILETPVPSAPPAAKMGHVKAVYMAAMNPAADTKKKFVDLVGKVKDNSVRLALLEAIDHLSPQGDKEIGDKLEAQVEADTKAGNKAATDEMYRISLKLRSRLP
jgi:hypothetical protein